MKTQTRSDYSSLNSLPQMWDLLTNKFGNLTAVLDPHSKPEVSLTYTELNQKIKQFAAGLQANGINPGAKISLFADNSPQWLIADQGIMTAGGVNVVRSSQAEREELLYILQDSDSTALVVENINTLDKLRPDLDNLPLDLIILISNEELPADTSPKTINFSQLIQSGENHQLQPASQTKDSLASLIYTSGTTGKPKGVMLSHGNLLHQVNHIYAVVQPEPGDHALSILPSWHSYERATEYFLFSRGCNLIYTNIRYFKQDLKKYKPHLMVGVPRLWDSIYEGVQKQFREKSATQQKLVNFFLGVSDNYLNAKRIAQGLSLDSLNASTTDKLLAQLQALLLAPLHSLGDKLVYQKIRQGVGGNVKSWISGGGSLAKHLDNFYQIVGIPLIVGYGLTETSPVTNARRLERNIVGASGPPLPETEVKIVNPDTGETLPPGKTGLVLIRGKQVMQGYYKKPEATAKAIDSEGWFDSGDLGWVTPMNDLVITGRAKDTIVLSNGENIEPQPIEDACIRSAYIDQMMIVGQDQKSLGALIIPNLDALQKWATEQNLSFNVPSPDVSQSEIEQSDLYSKPVLDLFREELNREVQNRPGYRADDRIGPYELILEPFSQENGMMTQTLKIKRPVVRERYQDMIDRMFKK